MTEADDPRAAARRYMVDLGIDGAYIDATTEDQWNWLVQELLYLGGPPTITVDAAAARTGVPGETIRRLWAGLGFADPGDEPVFREHDLAMFRLYHDGMAVFGDGPVERFGRTVGAAVRRIADDANTLFLEVLGAQHSNVLEWVQLSHLGGTMMARVPDDLVRPVLMRHALESQLFSAAAGATVAPEVTVAVGFCDLVGSTPLVTTVDPSVMGRAMIEFEARAHERALQCNGRVVKFVGDEVMFAAVAPADAEAIAVDLVRWAADHDVFTGARAGIAQGRVLFRGGDLYGAAVNLAARLRAAAADGTVLVADPDGDDVRELRGFTDPVPVRTVVPADSGS